MKRVINRIRNLLRGDGPDLLLKRQTIYFDGTDHEAAGICAALYREGRKPGWGLARPFGERDEPGLRRVGES